MLILPDLRSYPTVITPRSHTTSMADSDRKSVNPIPEYYSSKLQDIPKKQSGMSLINPSNKTVSYYWRALTRWSAANRRRTGDDWFAKAICNRFDDTHRHYADSGMGAAGRRGRRWSGLERNSTITVRWSIR